MYTMYTLSYTNVRYYACPVREPAKLAAIHRVYIVKVRMYIVYVRVQIY